MPVLINFQTQTSASSQLNHARLLLILLLNIRVIMLIGVLKTKIWQSIDYE